MKFDFPKNNKKEGIQIKLRLSYINKARQLAQLNDCTISEIYETLIEEAIDDYEQLNSAIEENPRPRIYSHKRDLYEAGDNRRNEVTQAIEEEKIITKKPIAYCQYAKCPHKKEGPFLQTDMIKTPDGLIFCTQECKESFGISIQYLT